MLTIGEGADNPLRALGFEIGKELWEVSDAQNEKGPGESRGLCGRVRRPSYLWVGAMVGLLALLPPQPMAVIENASTAARTSNFFIENSSVGKPRASVASE